MELLIIFEERHVYGRVLYYPVSAQAKVFTEIAGRVCLRKPEIEAMRTSGMVVEIQDAPHELPKTS